MGTLKVGVDVDVGVLDGVAHAGAGGQVADVCDRRAIGLGLVEDGAHARAVGNVQPLHRQPTTSLCRVCYYCYFWQ